MARAESLEWSNVTCLCKLKHDIRVESKIELAKREIEECLGVRTKIIQSIPVLVRSEPFLRLNAEVIHRITRLLYLGKAQGFLTTLTQPLGNILKLMRRATYLREIYLIIQSSKQGLLDFLRSLGFDALTTETLQFNSLVDIDHNTQLFSEFHKHDDILTTLFIIPGQTLLEYSLEILKLPCVTFTKQYTRLDERLDAMEKGIKVGMNELLKYVAHEFRRMPWLGLYKEHIGDYVDWAFSDFRTWGLHFIHKHEGKADPWLARSALNLLNVEENGLALDPYCGSGTFLADTPLMSIDSIGVDVNPLSTMIANVKCNVTRLPLTELKEAIIDIHSKMTSSGSPHGISLRPILQKVEAKDSNKIMERQKEVERILLIRQKIDEQVNEEPVKGFLYTILSRSIVDAFEKKQTRNDIYDGFLKDTIDFYLSAYATQEILSKLGLEAKGTCKIHTGDSHNIQDFVHGKVNGIVSSPPYFDALDYVGFSRMPILLLGLDKNAQRLAVETIGSRGRTAKDMTVENLPESSRMLIDELAKHGRTEKVRVILQYLIDMRDCLTSFSKILKDDGRIIFVVGRYHHWKFGRDELEVDGAQVLIDIGEQAGLTLEDEFLHNISKIEAGTRIREESIIMWRKDGIQSKRNSERSAHIFRMFKEKTEVKQLDNWIAAK